MKDVMKLVGNTCIKNSDDNFKNVKASKCYVLAGTALYDVHVHALWEGRLYSDNEGTTLTRAHELHSIALSGENQLDC